MDILKTIAALFIVDFVLHIIQFTLLNRIKSPMRNGAFVFMIIYGALGASMLLTNIDWLIYPAFGLPLVGFIGLYANLKRFAISKWINYSIVLVDLLIIIFAGYLIFLT